MGRSVGWIAAVALVVALPAWAECPLPAPAPAVPKGSVSTTEQMKAGHDVMQSYVNTLQTYQACTETQIKTAPADTREEMKNAWRAQGNAAIDEAHQLADEYTAQLQIFKARGK